MQTQRRKDTNTVDQARSAIHTKNNYNISKINYQHVATRPPAYAVCMPEIMHIIE